MQLVDTLIAPYPNGIEVVLVHGMGGIGKSTTAKIAYQAAYLGWHIRTMGKAMSGTAVWIIENQALTNCD